MLRSIIVIRWSVTDDVTRSVRAGAGRERQRDEREPRHQRAGLEHVLGVDRQERRDAAEQHGEQVERDRAEHHLVVTDVAEAGEHRLDIPGGAQYRVLVRGATAKDDAMTVRELGRAGIAAQACATPADMLSQLPAGAGAAFGPAPLR